jgi:hypothetical protein
VQQGWTKHRSPRTHAFSSGHDITAKSVGTFAATRDAARSWLSGRGGTSVQQDPQTRPVGGRPAVGRRWQRDRVSTSDGPKYLTQSNARGRLGTVSKQTAAGPASAASLRLGPRDSNGAFSTFLISGPFLRGAHKVLARDSILEPRRPTGLAPLSDPAPTRQSCRRRRLFRNRWVLREPHPMALTRRCRACLRPSRPGAGTRRPRGQPCNGRILRLGVSSNEWHIGGDLGWQNIRGA